MPPRTSQAIVFSGSHLERTQAALAFAKRVLRATGRVAPHDITVMRDAGFSDHEIVAIVDAVMGRRAHD